MPKLSEKVADPRENTTAKNHTNISDSPCSTYIGMITIHSMNSYVVATNIVCRFKEYQAIVLQGE